MQSPGNPESRSLQWVGRSCCWVQAAKICSFTNLKRQSCSSIYNVSKEGEKYTFPSWHSAYVFASNQEWSRNAISLKGPVARKLQKTSCSCLRPDKIRKLLLQLALRLLFYFPKNSNYIPKNWIKCAFFAIKSKGSYVRIPQATHLMTSQICIFRVFLSVHMRTLGPTKYRLPVLQVHLLLFEYPALKGRKIRSAEILENWKQTKQTKVTKVQNVIVRKNVSQRLTRTVCIRRRCDNDCFDKEAYKFTWPDRIALQISVWANFGKSA